MKRKTADERDRAIVAKAGPWRFVDDGHSYSCNPTDYTDKAKMLQALARILNRICREERP